MTAAERLRRNLVEQAEMPPIDVLIVQRATVLAVLDERDALRAEVERLRTALREIDTIDGQLVSAEHAASLMAVIARDALTDDGGER